MGTPLFARKLRRASGDFSEIALKCCRKIRDALPKSPDTDTWHVPAGSSTMMRSAQTLAATFRCVRQQTRRHRACTGQHRQRNAASDTLSMAAFRFPGASCVEFSF
jgi:hypothetical protein